FDGERYTLTAADTERSQPFAGVSFNHFVYQRDQNTTAGRPYRVTERTRAAVHIHPLRIPFKHFSYRERLCRKSFVHLYKINITKLPARTLKASTSRVNRRDPHQRRINAHAGKSLDARQYG